MFRQSELKRNSGQDENISSAILEQYFLFFEREIYAFSSDEIGLSKN